MNRMNDTISRQAAIEAVTAWLHKAFNPLNRSKYNDGEVAAYKTALSELKKIPSVERRGRWINGNEGIWNAVILPKCSICGETFYEMNVNINGEYPYNYCPNCGARMEVE